MAHLGWAKFNLLLLEIRGRKLVGSVKLLGWRKHKGTGRNHEHFRGWRWKEQTGESPWCWGSGPGGCCLLLLLLSGKEKFELWGEQIKQHLLQLQRSLLTAMLEGRTQERPQRSSAGLSFLLSPFCRMMGRGQCCTPSPRKKPQLPGALERADQTRDHRPPGQARYQGRSAVRSCPPFGGSRSPRRAAAQLLPGNGAARPGAAGSESERSRQARPAGGAAWPLGGCR